jgi:hypothetical protein
MDEDAGARRRMDAPDGPQPTAQMRTSRSEFMFALFRDNISDAHCKQEPCNKKTHTDHISKHKTNWLAA